MCNTRLGADDVSDRPPDLRFLSTNASPVYKGSLPNGYLRNSRFNGGMRSRSEGKRFRDGVERDREESKGNEGAKGRVDRGTDVYVWPPDVIGNLKAVAPRFNRAGPPEQQLSMDNPVLQASQHKTFRKPKMCQTCGHLVSTERYAINYNVGGFWGGK